MSSSEPSQHTGVHTAILGAMDEELQESFRHGERLGSEIGAGFVIHHVSLFGRRCVMVRCDIGKVFAAMVCQRLIDVYRRPTWLSPMWPAH